MELGWYKSTDGFDEIPKSFTSIELKRRDYLSTCELTSNCMAYFMKKHSNELERCYNKCSP